MAGKTYHHGDLRSALLTAGQEVLERIGPEGASLRAIAREAGVSSAAPYHHFADREALLAALAARGFGELAGDMRRAAERGRGAGPLEGFRRAGVAYVRFAVRRPALFRLMFSGLLSDQSAYPDLQLAADEAFDVLRRLPGEDAGRAPAGRTPDPRALTAWSTVHGLAVLLIEGRLGQDPTERDATRLAQEVTEVLGRGLVDP